MKEPTNSIEVAKLRAVQYNSAERTLEGMHKMRNGSEVVVTPTLYAQYIKPCFLRFRSDYERVYQNYLDSLDKAETQELFRNLRSQLHKYHVPLPLRNKYLAKLNEVDQRWKNNFGCKAPKLGDTIA